MKANKIGLAILGGIIAAFGLCANAGAQRLARVAIQPAGDVD